MSKDAPPELLEEVFELNMALEELRGGDDSARPQLEQARKRFHAHAGEIDDELQSLFAQYDASQSRDVLDADPRAARTGGKYISEPGADVDKELNVHVSN